jgi:hypothetical protein
VSLFRQTRLSVGGQSASEQSHAGSSHKPYHIVLLLGVVLVSIAYDSGSQLIRNSKHPHKQREVRGPFLLTVLWRAPSLSNKAAFRSRQRVRRRRPTIRRPRRRSHWVKSSFSRGACQWMELSPAVHATIRHALSLTEDQFLLASTGAPASATLRRY